MTFCLKICFGLALIDRRTYRRFTDPEVNPLMLNKQIETMTRFYLKVLEKNNADKSNYRFFGCMCRD